MPIKPIISAKGSLAIRGKADTESEREFQEALIHLYLHIHEYESYSDALFANFKLSDADRRSLRELMTSQRDRLLVFNQQLRFKQRRYIRAALPRSAKLLRRELDDLIDAYATRLSTEGADDAATTIRVFADQLKAHVAVDPYASWEPQFILFEAAYASLALRRVDSLPEALRPRETEVGLSLPRGPNHFLATSSYDVVAKFKDSVSPHFAEKTQYLLLFRTRRSSVRILSLAAKLHGILEMLEQGICVGDILKSVQSTEDKMAALEGVRNLWSIGVPFSIRAPA